jgi:ribosomal-protein-alanine N-acetyltransferase
MPNAFTFISGHEAYPSSMVRKLIELDQNFFPTPWTKDSWSNLFLEHDRLLVIMTFEDQVIGFCLLDLAVADSFGHLLKILITPHFRGRGLATELLKSTIDYLAKQNIGQLYLEVEASNFAAQKTYSSQGFKSIHLKKDFYGQGRDAIIMTKN